MNRHKPISKHSQYEQLERIYRQEPSWSRSSHRQRMQEAPVGKSKYCRQPISKKLLLAGIGFGVAATLSVQWLIPGVLTKTDVPQKPSVSSVEPPSTSPSPARTSEPASRTASTASIASSVTEKTGLAASKSTITGIVDSQTLTASFYWTLLLTNPGTQPGEAVAEFIIPEGSAVSRATLWINGVPQEAAFNSAEKVSQAYNWVSAGRRDPMLITWLGSNRVQVKASPVPANGRLKIRMGITSPLALSRSGDCTVTVPSIEKSNFEVVGKQDLHLESASKISNENENFRVDSNRRGRFILRANLDSKDLEDIKIVCKRNEVLPVFATRAKHAPIGTYIVGTLREGESGNLECEYSYTANRPDCQIIHSDAAAHRVSNLWAHQEIENLLAKGDRKTAVDLGTAYRLVSEVTGATVLERQSDYDRYRLHRNIGQTVAYQQVPGFEIGLNGNNSLSTDGIIGGGNNSSAYAVSGEGHKNPFFNTAPILQGAINGTIGQQGEDANSWTGPISGWLMESSRGACLFDSPNLSWPKPPIWFAVLSLISSMTICAWTLAKWRSLPVILKLCSVPIGLAICLIQLWFGIL